MTGVWVDYAAKWVEQVRQQLLKHGFEQGVDDVIIGTTSESEFNNLLERIKSRPPIMLAFKESKNVHGTE